jgi:cell division protein FtsB
MTMETIENMTMKNAELRRKYDGLKLKNAELRAKIEQLISSDKPDKMKNQY